MEALHLETRRLLVTTRNQLEALESASTNPSLDPTASSAVISSFRSNVILLGTKCSELRSLLRNEGGGRKELWRARLNDLDDQIGELRAGDIRCTSRFRRITSERMMREELFQRRNHGHGGGGGGDTILKMGGLVEEGKSLERSGNMMGGILGTGRSALRGLVEQREKLGGVKRKMMGVMKSMGVDRKIIARIERREMSDRILVYGCMFGILLLLLIALLWKHHRREI